MDLTKKANEPNTPEQFKAPAPVFIHPEDDYTKMIDKTVLLTDTLHSEFTKLLDKFSQYKNIQNGQEVLLAVLSYLEYLNNEPSINHDNSNLLTILPFLLKLQNRKEAQYGRSWCKKGDVSAFFNIERKYDRVDNIMGRALEDGVKAVLCDNELSGTPTETFLDTVVDMGIYSLMWAGFIREERYEQWERFIYGNNLND